ncbi:chemosensory receptor A [Elysia marginata]|uniref:Chemosensory receptor A n=1 Tax=Elysia marginata TaxID=1093978 RepID=A0AAV4EXP0_9GAST|nr:chemosensory receptor A [Elysia marginata]
MNVNMSQLNETIASNSTETPVIASVKPYLVELFITLGVLAHVWPAIILFGLVVNCINIVVFLKTGAKDNVTILLFSLSMSDLMFLILITPTMCALSIIGLNRSYPWPFDNEISIYLFYWPAYTIYDVSAYISLSLGLMRCACVAMPLKFKSFFTTSRTLKWLVLLVVLAISLRMPMLSVVRIGWRTDPTTNVSEAYVILHNGSKMVGVDNILNRTLIMPLAFLTMIFCVIILSYKLYEASRIRQSTTGKASRNQGLSSKDLRVVQSVTLVCGIFILSQLIFVISSLIRYFIPEYGGGQRLSLLHSLVNKVGMTCSYMNASLNIFVYYRYNSKYRATFKALLCGKANEE